MYQKVFIYLVLKASLMANCVVDTMNEYYPVVDSTLPRVVIDCMKSKEAVKAGCVKRREGTYTLLEDTMCLYNHKRYGALVYLYPDKKERPRDVTVLLSKDNLDIFPNGFDIKHKLIRNGDKVW